MTPYPMPRKTMRLGGVAGACDAAEAKRRKPNDSRNGKAINAEPERRKWRRDFIDFEAWIETRNSESEHGKIRVQMFQCVTVI